MLKDIESLLEEFSNDDLFSEYYFVGILPLETIADLKVLALLRKHGNAKLRFKTNFLSLEKI